MTPFSFKISDISLAQKPAKLVAFHGELDESNVDTHAETIYELIKMVPRETHFVFDGEKLTYLNSKAIGYLTDWYNKIQQRDGKLFLINLHSAVFDVLDIVGITQIIPVYKDIKAISLK